MRCCITILVGIAVGVSSADLTPLSSAEVKQIRADLLHHHGEADLDGDGEVSSAELATHSEKVAGATDKLRAARKRQHAATEVFITNADTNGDGKVSREEFVAAHATHHAEASSSGEGKPLSAADRAQVEAMAVANWNSLYSTTGDDATLTIGSAVELAMGFKTAAEKLVTAGDTNGDGKLSLSEMQKISLGAVPHRLQTLLHTREEL